MCVWGGVKVEENEEEEVAGVLEEGTAEGIAHDKRHHRPAGRSALCL